MKGSRQERRTKKGERSLSRREDRNGRECIMLQKDRKLKKHFLLHKKIDWTKGLVGNIEGMRRKSCFSTGSHTCGLTENFPSFSLLKKCSTPKVCSALLHTLVSQPIVSESYSPSNQTSELVKLRLNNNGCARAFLILFWGPLVSVPVPTPFPLA